jgi:CubicO group peptidase (beta-lactamase class C family)
VISLDRDGTAALSAVLRTHVAGGTPPAVVAIAVNAGEVVFLDAAGARDAGHGVAATPDTIFRIASMTKAVTSLAGMMLVEDGRMALDDTVASRLPGFVQPPVVTAVREDGTFDRRPAARPITIRHLLTHTSGIAYPPFDATLRRLSAAGVADSAMPLVADPGVRFAYGPGTALLGRVVAAVSGATLDEFCQARIFGPLGMTDTAYAVPPDQASRVITMHQRQADGSLLERANPATFVSRGRGDDGLFSTARDYAAFMQLFLNNGTHHGCRLVGEPTISQMTANQLGGLALQPIDSADPLTVSAFLEGASKDGFGFGFQIEAAPRRTGRRRPGSLSWAGIFNTHFWIDPSHGVAAALLMQMLPANDPGVVTLLIDFEQTLYQRLRS